MKQVLKELISLIFRNGFIQDAAKKNAVIALNIYQIAIDLYNTFFFNFSGQQWDWVLIKIKQL